MRTILLLPLTALVAVVAGCRSEAREQTARDLPQRDLTLITQTAEVTVASPVEMRPLRSQRRTVVPVQRPARRTQAPRSGGLEPKLILAAVAAQPAGTASTADNDRELLPGKTVTLIPTSSGPSTSVETPDELPPQEGTMVVWGGGKCGGRGRGPGIGIAAAPRPDFR